ncbi:MAG: DUF4956 domain-containing protein [Kofleriaceae bacterium]
MNQLFGTDTLFDPEDFAKLFARLGMDLVFATIIVVFVYYRRYRNRELVFVYYVFNVITFVICILLRKTPLDMGFALGLFAIFGIMRYRTEEIRLRDLTYMFILIGVGLVNAVANKKVSLSELVAVNCVIAGMVAVLELHPRARRGGTTPYLYDRLDLLRPGQQGALHADLASRTGLDVVSVDVHRVDLLRDAAEITVHYHEP